jgi:heat shock protein HtpX
VAIVLAILAPIFARLVQLAVSRQREYLADATSVEFTRNPAGIERALAKIAEDQEVLEVANRATQHLYIVNPIKKFEERSKGLFSTHPPILDRINRLRALHGAPPVGGAVASALANLD